MGRRPDGRLYVQLIVDREEDPELYDHLSSLPWGHSTPAVRAGVKYAFAAGELKAPRGAARTSMSRSAKRRSTSRATARRASPVATDSGQLPRHDQAQPLPGRVQDTPPPRAVTEERHEPITPPVDETPRQVAVEDVNTRLEPAPDVASDASPSQMDEDTAALLLDFDMQFS